MDYGALVGVCGTVEFVDMRNEEEQVLRQWNIDDPPDDTELRRHQAIFNVQRSRNPFVDDPSLAERIGTF